MELLTDTLACARLHCCLTDSIEKFLLRSISTLKSEWHKDCADIVASFVLKLEEPALLVAEAAVKAEAAVGMQKADPSDKDFHRQASRCRCRHHDVRSRT